MRIASTTVPTSFEQLSIIMLRERSSCSSSFSVSMPFISGMSTSRIIRSGRSPSLTFARTSLPEPTVSTSKPSTSNNVCKYFRILGSSSTTRIFSFTAIDSPSAYRRLCRSATTNHSAGELSLIHRQKKRKFAAVGGFALHPDLTAMGLHEAFGDGEVQTHARRIAVDPDEILENFLVMFGRDSRSGIGD